MKTNGTLSVGKYFIELSNGPAIVYCLDESGEKRWICSTTDPQKGMDIIEGLILVETKRFYYPETGHKINNEESNKPPFLRNLKNEIS